MSKADELKNLYAAFKRKAQGIIDDHQAKSMKFEEQVRRNKESQPESNAQESFCDFRGSKLGERLNSWSASHRISISAMKELHEILTSFEYSISSDGAIPTFDTNNEGGGSVKNVDSYISDSNSNMEVIKDEYLDDSFIEEKPEEITLEAVMMKINAVISMVNATNLDVRDIKETLSRIANAAPLDTQPTTYFEDFKELIPGIELPVKTKEELSKLENYLSDAENTKRVANRIKFETVDLKKSLYCNFSSIGEKLICNSLAAEYSLCGQRGKLRFLDFKSIVAFMKYTCRIGYESRYHLFTFSEIEQDKAIGSFLRYIKSRPID